MLLSKLRVYSVRLVYLLLLIYCCCNGHELQAKTFFYKHYSIDDGLPSSQVYCVLQDQNGYLWFGTDRGVVRFDGKNFEIFTTNDGLSDNVVFKIKEDRKGRIWFVTFSGSIDYYEKGRVRPYKYSDVIKNQYPSNTILSIYVSEDDQLEIGLRGLGVITVDQYGNLKRGYGNGSGIILDNNKERLLFYGSREGQKSKIELNIGSRQKEFDLSSSNIDEATLAYYVRVAEIDPDTSGMYCALNETFLCFRNNQLAYTTTFEHRILSIKVSRDFIFIGFYQGGYTMLNKKTFEPMFSDLKAYSITDVGWDNNNGIWLSTLENGVYYLPNYYHYSYTIKDGLSSNYLIDLDGSKDEVIMIDGLGHLTVLNLKNMELEVIPYQHKKSSRSFVKYNPYDDSFYIRRYDVTQYKNGKTNMFAALPYDMHLFSRDTNLIFLYRDYSCWLAYQTKDSIIPIETNCKPYGVINPMEIFRSRKGQLFLGCLNGLYEVKSGRLEHWGKKNRVFNTRVVEIRNHPDYDFIIATRGAGLVLVKGNQVSMVGELQGLLSNQITAIDIDQEGVVWLGTSRGVSKYKPGNEIVNIRNEDGLISEEVNDLFVSDDRLFVATKKGITILNKDLLREGKTDVPIYFKKAKLKNKEVDLSGVSSIQISHAEPFLELSFIGISHKFTDQVFYKYRLINAGDTWETTKNDKLVFTNLTSGDYILEIYASDGNDNWSKLPAILEINVAFPFWKTTGFIIIVSALTLIIILLVFQYLIKRIRVRERLKRQVQNLKLEALNAQMNPHFIFNSLNSIQNFVISNDRKSSNRYLSKFSKLMRKTLVHSQSVNISLEQELEALELYLDLEQLRFDEQIQYSIDVSPQINPEQILLPTLLIQPIVENSVWHGLRHKTDGGKIQVKIDREEDFLIIIIEDNGVGRAFHQQTKRIGHKSKGSALTVERIRLFAAYYGMAYNFAIFDLEKNQIPRGTRVEIKIPYIKNDI